MATFPGNLPAVPQPSPTQYTDDPGFELDLVIKKIAQELDAVATKVGTSAASPADSPVADRFLGSDATGKSKWQQLVIGMIPNLLITTGKIADNATSQISQAVGVTSGPTTTSTTLVDMTDMAVTLTTTGGPVLCILIAGVENNTGGSGVFVALRYDANADSDPIAVTCSTAGAAYIAVFANIFTGVSAGSHTFYGRWRTTAGTATATAARRRLIVLELKK